MFKWTFEKTLANTISEDHRIHGAIDELVKLSLVKRKASSNEGHDGLWIHPLLHHWASEYSPDANNQKKELQKRENTMKAIAVVGAAIAFDPRYRKQREWAFERRILPHLNHCYDYISTSFTDDSVDAAALAKSIQNIATTAVRGGHYNRADYLYRKAIIYLEMDGLNRYITIGNLARCLSRQGKDSEALDLAREALAGLENLRGPEDMELLSAIDLLGRMLRRTGKLEESLQMHLRVYDRKMKILGPKDLAIIMTIQNIGRAYTEKREFDKAQEWIERSVEGFDRLFGPGHPYSLRSLLAKALYLAKEGRIHEALATYSQVLIGQENSLGKDHPSTQRTARATRRIRKKIEVHSRVGSAVLNKSQLAGDADRPRGEHEHALLVKS
jgi:tetratricopeptide (TPR) repeat protein